MAKIADFLPKDSSFVRSHELAGFFDFLSKSGVSHRTPTPGIEAVVNSWLMAQASNRPILIQTLFILASTVSELRGPILVIEGEVFRKGTQWEPKFSRKCSDCGEEFSFEVDSCSRCGSTNLVAPDESQRKRFEKFSESVNEFGQSLLEVLKSLSRDMNKVDDAFLCLVNDYYQDGDEIKSRLSEIRRIHPGLVEFDLNDEGRPCKSHWFCLLHREMVYGEPGVCPECGAELVPAMYKFTPMFLGSTMMPTSGGPSAGKNKTIYFTREEICHTSKFEDSELYGTSPILTVFEKALTLIGMERTLYRYFYERKIPSSIILTTTDDPESLRREKDHVMAKVREDPDGYVPWIGVSQKTGRGRTDLIRLFHTLQEMDYLPVKQEIRERIASIYGVSPVWQGVSEARGGMMSQTQELVVTSRAVEREQTIFNEKILPAILNAFGVTDWRLKLRQPEEKAEATRIQFAQQRSNIAQTLWNMGFTVEIAPGTRDMDDVKFIVSGEAMDKSQQQMGMMGGMPGMGGPGGEEMPGLEGPQEEGEEEQPEEEEAGSDNFEYLLRESRDIDKGGVGSGRKSPAFRPEQEYPMTRPVRGEKAVDKCDEDVTQQQNKRTKREK